MHIYHVTHTEELIPYKPSLLRRLYERIIFRRII